MPLAFGICSGYCGSNHTYSIPSPGARTQSLMSAQVTALREVLEQRFPGAAPAVYQTTPGVSTGMAAIDAILPNGSLPRGRLCNWEAGIGAGAILRSACAAALARGERAAWIDAAGTVSSEVPWTGAALVRPKTAADALLCAEELTRSGGFALIVLSGASTAGVERVRLTRAVREGGTSLVEISGETHMSAVRFQSWVPEGGYRWSWNGLREPIHLSSVAVRVRAAALGWSRETEVKFPVKSHALRLYMEPSLVNRRGATR